MSDELMELPQGWEWAKLSELATLINGDRGKNYPSKNAFVEVGIPFINAGHLQDGIIRFSEMNYITEKHFSLLGGGKVQSNDILYCLRGSLGKTAIVKDKAKGAIASSLVIVRPSQYSEPEYLFNFLNSPFGKAEIRKFDNGSAQPNLSAKSLGEYSVPLPPLNEQKRIVAAIESLRERSQKARSALSTIPDLCNKFRQSVLAAAFRGDLTADWREQNPDVDPASVLLEKIRRDRQNELIKQKVNLEEIELSSLPEIPDTWEWERLVNISRLLGGVTKGRKFNGQVTVQVPYLRVANVQDGFLDLEEIKEIEVLPEDINKYRLEHGDILFTEGGDRDKLGRGTVWKDEIEGCIHQNHIYRARLFNSNVLPEYISLAAKTKYAKDYFFHNASQTVNLASINISTLGKLPLPIPPTDEQKEICSRIYKLFEIAEIIKANHYNLLHQFNQIDRSILAKAFRGELVEQDPNDEPASVLLDRIRAGREQQAQGKAKKLGKKAAGASP